MRISNPITADLLARCTEPGKDYPYAVSGSAVRVRCSAVRTIDVFGKRTFRGVALAVTLAVGA